MGIFHIALFLISRLPLAGKEPTHFVRRISVSIFGNRVVLYVFSSCD